jgi:hypothetical protein
MEGTGKLVSCDSYHYCAANCERLFEQLSVTAMKYIERAAHGYEAVRSDGFRFGFAIQAALPLSSQRYTVQPEGLR